MYRTKATRARREDARQFQSHNSQFANLVEAVVAAVAAEA
jgi:hypothetical protein